jgi:predicted DNA-binding transcriptional regulator AlpA
MSTLQDLNQTNLSNFDQLPNSAYVRLAVALGLFSCSRATWWRWVKAKRVPAPKRMGAKNSVWSVAELREALKCFSDAQGPLANDVTNQEAGV